MDKKKKALLITAGIAAVLLAAALLLSRPQPLGELLHTDEIEPPIRAIFSLAATVPTENGETSGVCDYTAEPDSEAGQALLDALSGISAHRRFRHRIEPDAGAGGILLLDKIHHFSVHHLIPPIVMPCWGFF